jgi:hypothetical protein
MMSTASAVDAGQLDAARMVAHFLYYIHVALCMLHQPRDFSI